MEKYLDRQYGSPPCWELVADYYATEYGIGVDRYAVVTGSLREAAREFSYQLTRDAHGFVRLESPQDGCIVLLGGRRLGLHHAGIHSGGKLLHALGPSVLIEDLGAVTDRFALVEFWGKP